MMLHAKETSEHSLRPCMSENGQICLSGTILCLDSSCSSVSFLSCAKKAMQVKAEQIIATAETIQLLGVKKSQSKMLVCQYNRPFALGRLTLELIPSGHMLGSASLYVEMGSKTALYAPMIQNHQTQVARRLQSKKAQILVLEAPYQIEHQSLSMRKKIKDKLLLRIKDLLDQHQNPSIICSKISLAQELSIFLSSQNIDVQVDQSIYKMHKMYEKSGVSLGKYSLLKKKSKSPCVSLHAKEIKEKSQDAWYKSTPHVLQVFDQSYGIRGESLTDKEGCFFLSSVADSAGMQEFIEQVAPEKIYFFGAYAKNHSEHFKKLAKEVSVLYPKGSSYPLF